MNLYRPKGWILNRQLPGIRLSLSLPLQWLWGQKVPENDYLCYDITSVSSYGPFNEYLKFGYNREGESLKQINLVLLFGQKSQLPVYYHQPPGKISDVTTLHHFLKTFRYLEIFKLHLVLDKGFYSGKNANELLAGQDKFVLSVPIRRKWLQMIIDQVRKNLPDLFHRQKNSGAWPQSIL